MIRPVLLIKFSGDSHLSEIHEGFTSMPCKNSRRAFRPEWGSGNSPDGKSAGFTHCVIYG
ncbi:Uncharacterised protein [Citrobacter freundii]|nr:Uncharacterised protein [Citrobacter freundii]